MIEHDLKVLGEMKYEPQGFSDLYSKTVYMELSKWSNRLKQVYDGLEGYEDFCLKCNNHVRNACMTEQHPIIQVKGIPDLLVFIKHFESKKEGEKNE